jgi:hypothetical protein
MARSERHPKAAALIAACVAVALTAGTAQALPRAVTAHSDHGNGSVTAPVRINRQGYPEVRLPGGFWADCEGDCRETLRRMYLDFWETMEEDNSGDNEYR